jgi:hypothetical protein
MMIQERQSRMPGLPFLFEGRASCNRRRNLQAADVVAIAALSGRISQAEACGYHVRSLQTMLNCFRTGRLTVISL